jgi:hypothetical protein
VVEYLENLSGVSGVYQLLLSDLSGFKILLQSEEEDDGGGGGERGARGGGGGDDIGGGDDVVDLKELTRLFEEELEQSVRPGGWGKHCLESKSDGMELATMEILDR